MTIELYQAADGWRWRMIARNGRIIADSGEAYTRKASARAAVGRLTALFKAGIKVRVL